MHENGTVVRVHGGTVDVSMTMTADCGGCTACAKGSGGETIMRDVVNTLSAAVGDTVDVLIPDEIRARAAAAVFVVPVLGLLAGYVIGFLAGERAGMDPDLAGFIGAAALAVTAFLGIKRTERRLAADEQFRPRVNAILARGHERV